MQTYTFKQIQERLGFGSDFSVDRPIFLRFPTNVKVAMNKIEYNGTDCLVGQMKHQITIQGSRKPTLAIPVMLCQENGDGKPVDKIEGFISPDNVFFQSAREDETRISVPPWYGNEKAYEASIVLAKQVEEMVRTLSEKHNISLDQARDMLRVAKADVV